jgi:hypothetical protein
LRGIREVSIDLPKLWYSPLEPEDLNLEELNLFGLKPVVLLASGATTFVQISALEYHVKLDFIC